MSRVDKFLDDDPFAESRIDATLNEELCEAIAGPGSVAASSAAASSGEPPQPARSKKQQKPRAAWFAVEAFFSTRAPHSSKFIPLPVAPPLLDPDHHIWHFLVASGSSPKPSLPVARISGRRFPEIHNVQARAPPR